MYMLQIPNLEDLLFSHKPAYARKQGSLTPLENFGCALIGIINMSHCTKRCLFALCSPTVHVVLPSGQFLVLEKEKKFKQRTH